MNWIRNLQVFPPIMLKFSAVVISTVKEDIDIRHILTIWNLSAITTFIKKKYISTPKHNILLGKEGTPNYTSTQSFITA